MKRILIPSLLLLSAVSQAQGVNVEMQLNKDGDVDPISSFPLQWSEHYFSKISYRSVTYGEVDDSELMQRSSQTIRDQYLRLDLLGYQSSGSGMNWQLAGGAEAIRINREEFGYGEFNSQTLLLDNSVEVEVYRAVVSGEMRWQSEHLEISVGGDLSPYGSLTVEQDTWVSYNGEANADSSHSGTMKPAYGAQLGLVLKSGFDLDLELGAEYDYLPLEYDFDVLNSDGDDFNEETVTLKQKTTRLSAKLILPAYAGLGRLTLGAASEKIKTESADNTVNYVVFGMQQGF